MPVAVGIAFKFIVSSVRNSFALARALSFVNTSELHDTGRDRERIGTLIQCHCQCVMH
jgi:hypothetical protein